MPYYSIPKTESVIQFDEENIAKFRHYFVDVDVGKKAISIPRISYGDVFLRKLGYGYVYEHPFFFIPTIS